MNTDLAWVATKPVHDGLTPLYRTDNGGETWEHIGSLPYGCVLQFINPSDGWCSVIAAAMGSATVQLYRSTNGGGNWALVSISQYPFLGPSTTDALPTGCDKSITFTSPTQGWAASYCNAGTPWMYTTADTGTHWSPLPSVPVPAGVTTPQGEGLSLPAVAGRRLATTMSIGGEPGTTAVATSSDGGQIWHSQLVPNPTEDWSVDLVDPSHWVLTNGKTLMATDNAGRTWRTWTPSVPMKGADGTWRRPVGAARGRWEGSRPVAIMGCRDRLPPKATVPVTRLKGPTNTLTFLDVIRYPRHGTVFGFRPASIRWRFACLPPGTQRRSIRAIETPLFEQSGSAVVFWLLFGAYGLGEAVMRVRTLGRGGGARVGRWGQLVVVVGIVAAILGGIGLASTGTATITTWRWPLFIAGLVLEACGISVRQWAIFTLGRFFTGDLRTYSDQKIVVTGPYRWVRHPSYSGLVIFFCGFGLALGNGLSLLVLVVVPTAALVARIHVEEHALLDRLGNAYREYACPRKRLFPGVW